MVERNQSLGVRLVWGLALLLGGCAGAAQVSPEDDQGPSLDQASLKHARSAPQTIPVAPPSAPVGNFAVMSVPGEEAPLEMRSLAVKVKVEGRLARTEVVQVFRNHTERQVEGTYTFTLPRGAAIARLAMDVKGKMMEGELVEREKARQIYEGIVRKQKDPALLEWQGGDRFQTQIFPIEPGEDKKVVLAYEQAISEQGGVATYHYNLPSFEGEPEGSHIASFFFEMKARGAGEINFSGFPAEVVRGEGGVASVVVEMEQFRPQGPFEVRFDRAQRDEAEVFYAERDGERFFMVDLAPKLADAKARDARDLVLALDTSAGLGRVEVARSLKVARELIDAAPESARISVVHGDYRVHKCDARSAATLRACLDGLSAGGATDLGGLIDAALSEGLATGRPSDVVLLSDGVASMGELDGDLLLAAVRERLKGGSTALHTVAVGHNPNLEGMAALAGEGRGHAMRMTPGDSAIVASETIARQIRAPLLTDLKVSRVEGKVEGLVPARRMHLAGTRAIAIMGRLPEGAATIKVSAMHGERSYERTFELKPPSERGIEALPRFWARAWIEVLQQGDIDRKRVVETSLKYGVMSRYTSFLVLESEEAYERFKIARRKESERQAQEARAENLTKGEGDLAEVLANKPDESATDGDGLIEEKEVEMLESEDKLEMALEKPKPLAEADENMKQLEELSKASESRDEKREMMKEIESLEKRQEELSVRDPAEMNKVMKKLEKKKDRIKRIDVVARRNFLLKMWETRDKLTGTDRVRFLSSLIHANMDDKAEIYLKECLVEAGDDLSAQYAYFTQHTTRQHFEARYLALVEAMVAAKVQREAVISEFIDSGQAKPQMVSRIVLAVCGGDDADSAACLGWLPRLEGDKDKALIAKLRTRRLGEIIEARRQDVGSAQLITEAVGLLQARGQGAEADRLLSELVEFAPHDYDKRSTYAQALTSGGDLVGACDQYATAVQLNPARRDTFRTMMGLRRDKESIAKALRTCLVQGVSKLPVRRDISLVLTWEDPSADVDLHIHEPGGEEVSYEHMESRAGGLLYYDVTDGFGPEIYVLGNAPRGRYRLTLVYYSGDRTNLKGTLTVLRHAGSPEEIRQDIPFTLSRVNDKAQIKATTLTID